MKKSKVGLITLAIHGFMGLAVSAAWITLSLVWFNWHLMVVIFLALYSSNLDKLVTRTLKEYKENKAKNDQEKWVKKVIDDDSQNNSLDNSNGDDKVWI